MKKIICFGIWICHCSIYAQGCSDAGVCSLSGNSIDVEHIRKDELEAGIIFGAGEADTQYTAQYLSYSRDFNQSWTASVKVTSSVASGAFGTRGSIGDAFLLAIYKPLIREKKRWIFSAGTKIPFNRANLKINDHPIPLDYQSSLGTFDFLANATLKYRKWDFNTAIQIPVININANSYFAEYSGTDDFPTTNLFERKPDVLFRALYTFKTGNKKFSFTPNLLCIYHLGEDTYEDIYGNRRSINGSDGFTINGNMMVSYQFKTSKIGISLAAPFVVREIRPDGLTREFTAAVSYTIGF